MKSFSIRRVAHYARYHYSVTRFRYLSFIVAVIALPTLFGILSKDLGTAQGMLVPIYLFGGVAMAVTTMRTMRDRGTKILDSVLPVSIADRQVFNIFNLAVVYPLLFTVIAAVALGIVAPFNAEEWITFGRAFKILWTNTLAYWPIYIFVQIVCSTCLLINICARRSLLLAYAMIFFATIAGFILFVCGLDWLSDNVTWNLSFEANLSEDLEEHTVKVIEYALKTFYCLIPVVIYALGYVALRRRQVKW
jgi:hypothetical protein